MRKRRCIDHTCSESHKSTLCTRSQFFFHVLKKPTEKLIEILKSKKLVMTPEILSRYTLANLFTDFSTEPMASAILEDNFDEK